MRKMFLDGISGANPLGFLAALGTLTTVKRFCPAVALGWDIHQGAWRPYLLEVMEDKAIFSEELAKSLSETSSAPFKIDKKLPFSIPGFCKALQETQLRSTPGDRRDADLLTAFGSEVCIDKNKNNYFEATQFRMVRTKDSVGQGFLCYAEKIRSATGAKQIHRALFQEWDYCDSGFSLRWDPVEDQRYALRWDDPSKNKGGTMNGANALALEALSLLPSFPRQSGLVTSGFFKSGRECTYFTWPIWESALSVDVVRSLLTLSQLHEETPPRDQLRARGIVEIYRCERTRPNKYYNNFSPSFSV